MQVRLGTDRDQRESPTDRRYHWAAPLVPLADSTQPTIRDQNASTPWIPLSTPPGEAHDAWPRPTPEPDSGFRGAPIVRRRPDPIASTPRPPKRRPRRPPPRP